MNQLLACAEAFQRLEDIEYRIVIGRKGKPMELQIRFPTRNFHHLAGLHKLRDLTLATENREKVFQQILDGRITYTHLMKSAYFNESKKRIEPLSCLELLLDTNQLIFRYNEKKQVFSLIQADFLLSTLLNDNDIYVFMSKSEDGTYFCRSLFPKDGIDYTRGQAKYTLLYKEKINRSTGVIEVQYDRLHN
ncbi:PBECR4 domain-containing protein [Bengtsoniella intestinalis]|uniref:PBECR4 domain-containing protein n=1 Tax=Bengtsoniella intestinalis TaxID=3073143 RepID=UPI00391F941C